MDVQYVGEHLIWGYAGRAALFLAFFLALFSTIAYFQASREGRTDYRQWRAWARRAFRVHSLMVGVAAFVLMFILLNHYYEYRYVWINMENDLSLGYKIAGFGEVSIGMDPFLLLRQAPEHMDNHFFHNPGYLSMITDGNGLNPLLRNFWMMSHPPVTFIGYAAVLVPFCYAVAALWRRQFHAWIRPAMPWMILGVLLTFSQKSVISENTSEYRLGEDFSETENLMLVKGEVLPMGKYYVTYVDRDFDGERIHYQLDFLLQELEQMYRFRRVSDQPYTVVIEVYEEQPEFIVIKTTIFPMINLLWLSIAVLLVGLWIAFRNRWRSMRREKQKS